MIPFFRTIRKKLADDNKPIKYLRYAIGEIVLVVIGILIAIQINNWNEANKRREKELHYLTNIKTDLYLNIKQIDSYITKRNEQIESASTMLQHMEGMPIMDINVLNAHALNIYTWQRFFQINNTFQELTNSGNLTLITNDSIKNALLDIDSQYKKLKAEEDHFRFDTETLLYKPLYRILDLNPAVINYTFHASNGQAGENIKLNEAQYEIQNLLIGNII
ncbi:MAG: hypothetical protein HOK84_16890 [Bacteroidetes bacterium]|nr:hypothetical protein [Bacteroidota bacterium]